jgi:hypothetical protein
VADLRAAQSIEWLHVEAVHFSKAEVQARAQREDGANGFAGL